MHWYSYHHMQQSIGNQRAFVYIPPWCPSSQALSRRGTDSSQEGLNSSGNRSSEWTVYKNDCFLEVNHSNPIGFLIFIIPTSKCIKQQFIYHFKLTFKNRLFCQHSRLTGTTFSTYCTNMASGGVILTWTINSVTAACELWPFPMHSRTVHWGQAW